MKLKPAHGIAAIGAAGLLVGGLASHILSTSSPQSTSAPDLISFVLPNGCGPDGAEPKGSIHAIENDAKNRSAIPNPKTDFLPNVTFATLAITAKPDELDGNKAASIEGWITEVKEGGVESCNCRSTDPAMMDTHIYLAARLGDPKSQSVICEVTPRLRMEMKDAGEDWSTETLKATLTGKHVRISGWLFFDGEHSASAENIHPGRKGNWRIGLWEIHPITRIEVLGSI